MAHLSLAGGHCDVAAVAARTLVGLLCHLSRVPIMPPLLLALKMSLERLH